MSTSGSKSRILLCEGDADAFDSQIAELQNAGHHVEKALERPGVMEALKRGSYDLVILGSTLSRNDRHHLPYMVKKCNRETKVLVLHADGNRHPQVDAFIDSGLSMDALLAAVASVLPQGRQSKAAGAASGR
jgi:DNA-binding NtrC family response regulator